LGSSWFGKFAYYTVFMKQKEKSDEKFKITYALSLVTQIGVVVSVITLLFLGFGYYADRYFSASPIFIILGAILALVSSMYAVYQLVLPVMKNNKQDKNN
jgi:F0F1-type ATP synthase assembly protein I